MSIFQTDSGRPRARLVAEPLLEAGTRHAGMEFLGERRGLLEELLALGRIEPGLQVGLAVEAQDGDEVLLDAGHRRLEAIALQAGRLGLGGGDLALPGAVLGLLARLTRVLITAETGAGLRPPSSSRTMCTSSRPISIGAAPSMRVWRSGEASQRCASSMVSKRCRITQSTCSGGLGGISRCSTKPGKLAMTLLVSPCQRAKSSARSGRTLVWVTMLTVIVLCAPACRTGGPA